MVAKTATLCCLGERVWVGGKPGRMSPLTLHGKGARGWSHGVIGRGAKTACRGLRGPAYASSVPKRTEEAERRERSWAQRALPGGLGGNNCLLRDRNKAISAGARDEIAAAPCPGLVLRESCCSSQGCLVQLCPSVYFCVKEGNKGLQET